ncbi:hypothetical protein [Streptomyces sp. DT9]
MMGADMGYSACGGYRIGAGSPTLISPVVPGLVTAVIAGAIGFGANTVLGAHRTHRGTHRAPLPEVSDSKYRHLRAAVPVITRETGGGVLTRLSDALINQHPTEAAR